MNVHFIEVYIYKSFGVGGEGLNQFSMVVCSAASLHHKYALFHLAEVTVEARDPLVHQWILQMRGMTCRDVLVFKGHSTYQFTRTNVKNVEDYRHELLHTEFSLNVYMLIIHSLFKAREEDPG